MATTLWQVILMVDLLAGSPQSRGEPHPSAAADCPAAPALAARCHDSGFPLAHDSYNSMGVASDGRVYYVLSSESLDVGAQVRLPVR